MSYTKGTVVVLLTLLLGRLVSLLLRALVARLGPREAGVFALSQDILTFGLVLVFLGCEGYLVREVALTKRRSERSGVLSLVLRLLFPLSLLFSFLLWFFSFAISEYVREPLLKSAVMLVAIALPFEVVVKSVALYYRGALLWKRFGWLECSRQILRLIFAMAMFLWLGSVTSVIAAQVATTVLLALLVLPFVVRRWNPSRVLSEPFDFALPLFAATVSFAALDWLDSVMLARLMSVADVGVYAAALTLAWSLQVLPTASMTFLLPKVMSNNGVQERVLALNVVMNGLLALVLIFFGESILNLLFTSVFTAAYPALVILAIGWYVGYSLLPSRTVLYAKKEGVILGCLGVGAVVCNALLNLFLIPRFGLLGAALATVISMFLLVMGYLFFGNASVLKSRLIRFSFSVWLLALILWRGLILLNVSPMFSVLLILGYIVAHGAYVPWRSEFKKLKL